ncbi:hypothetical protein PQO01_14670 [Lentisphaera marina]|uniref:glycoside hydrolase family 95-like protein n=1 Tax=Lentisphaera marina TaxID=1111041 RepID=UPI0023667DEB|nr:hypothetical protein [Lentisphaera marina]MDD7986192.1 hypothetical protein [Lentisphaera marina]
MSTKSYLTLLVVGLLTLSASAAEQSKDLAQSRPNIIYILSDEGVCFEQCFANPLCTPFQLDANAGATSGLVEMLLQSNVGELHMCPALPSKLPKGRVKDLKDQGNFDVDITWNKGKLCSATVNSLLRLKPVLQIADCGLRVFPFV